MPFLAPLAGAVVSAVASFSFAGALGVVGKAALAFGVNLGVSALTSRLGRQDAPVTAVEFDVQFGEGGARVARVGRYAVAGHLIYDNQYGSGGRQYQQVYQVSDWYTTSLDRVWVDGEEVGLGSEDPILGRPTTSGNGSGRIHLKFYDGRQTEADAGLVQEANPSDRWDESFVGFGISYIVVTMRLDREELASPPQMFFELSGAPLYDPRKDSTVGGVGSHRLADPMTWEFSENPILMFYAYLRGFSYNDDVFCGMELPTSDLPLSQYVLAANVCDEITASLQPRYRASVGFDCLAEHSTNLSGLTTSFGGFLVNAVEGIYPYVGTNRAPVATLTDDDLIVGEAVQFQRLRPMNELINSVSGTFVDPDNQWSPIGYQRATQEGLLTTDRRTRDATLDFPTVPYSEQSAQLASIYFSENRFEANGQIVVRPRWQVLEVGDWVVWESEMYGTYTCLVNEVSINSTDVDGPRNVNLSLQERSGEIYNSVGVVTPPPLPSPSLAPVFQQELQNFSVIPSTVVGDDGRIVPAIRTGWTAPDDPTVIGALIEYRVKAAPENIFTVPVDRLRTLRILTDGVVSSTVYEVRHRLQTDPPRPVTASDWVEVTTAESTQDDISVTFAELQPDITSALAGFNAAQNNLASRIEEVAANQAVTALSVLQQRGRENVVTRVTDQSIRQVQSGVGDLDAAVSGQANAITSIETGVSDLGGVVTSTANSLSGVLATVEGVENNLSAGGLIQFSGQADEESAIATVELLARASADGEAHQTGFSVRVNSDGSIRDVIFDADRFVVTDGENESSPLVFDDGVLTLQSVRLQNLDAQNINIENGRIFIGQRDGVSLIEMTSNA